MEKLEKDVVDLQRLTDRHDFLLGKFESAIDKISEVSINVSRLLAVHEQRIEHQEDVSKTIQDYLEKRRQEVEMSFVSVYEKITVQEQGIRSDMTNYQKEILTEIKNVRDNINTMSSNIVKANQDLKEELQEEFESKIDEVNGRISALEKLSWIVVGGSTVVGFLISQLSGYLQLFQ